jgi:hypothetical protein
MATHDASAGTGGLDASIMYEVDRDENKGDAFNNTLGDLSEFLSRHISASDLIALGVVASVASCGGPKIPFRAGRIDAVSAGPLGVPEAHSSLDSTVEAFARIGFNERDMIGLVACGHSIGQVHSVDFPEIVGGQPEAGNVARFDRTAAALDNAVVNEYLENDGINPLAFGRNDTTNSDKRVFGADGNATMRALSDPSNFSNTCGSLMERMINTVPAQVQLSEPLELQAVKPYIDVLQLNSGVTTSFAGRVRVRTGAKTGRNADKITVALDVLDRAGKHSVVPAIRARFRGGQSFGFFNEEFTWFEFKTELDPEAGIVSFNIQLTTAGGGSEVFDNVGTGGYPVQSDLLFLQADSCLDTSIVEGNMTLRVTAAVRQGEGKGEVLLDLAHRIRQQGVMLPKLVSEVLPMKYLGTSRGPFFMYSLQVPVEAEGWSTDFDLVLRKASGDIISGPHRTSPLARAGCISV